MSKFVARPADGCAWITGASSGIGRSVCQLLAEKGWTVLATARKAEDLASLASEPVSGKGRIMAMTGDVTDPKRMAEIVTEAETEHGGIALAVLNAGIYLPITADELSVEAFRRTFDVNLTGTTNALVPAIDAMKRRGRGQIAITSSVAGFGGLPTSAAYGATKAGLTNLAESLKFDLDKMGIRIQSIHPGFVDTPATKDNPFPMPFLMQVDQAAKQLVKGLENPRGFEITFPKGFTYGLKLLNKLPYPIYFWLINRSTGWSKRPLASNGH